MVVGFFPFSVVYDKVYAWVSSTNHLLVYFTFPADDTAAAAAKKRRLNCDISFFYFLK